MRREVAVNINSDFWRVGGHVYRRRQVYIFKNYHILLNGQKSLLVSAMRRGVPVNFVCFLDHIHQGQAGYRIPFAPMSRKSSLPKSLRFLSCARGERGEHCIFFNIREEGQACYLSLWTTNCISLPAPPVSSSAIKDHRHWFCANAQTNRGQKLRFWGVGGWDCI